ncbi:TrmH family RNA methyltransferase [Candidatus Phytoplasma fabacearum]|uniref:TrmH family RNA methyltransferase n=1 Tax=Candidatus Phytoplasma fabacearum TaxID=2982628 RepID=UPI002713F5B4|nr:RNA methyltransferase ['Bituminaria bituminosa' little leaf phytoplasma]MDV3148935.1 RNA methyltransferase [Pigeon pea little leaf phytoplasma]MDO7983462.1 RNA methyltransferase ['Bituminaria bituminosa' little leaf phytoplasma]MDO8030402.1 RNA methyltransferase ['Bituminaria bituminosa' little leaf phytoplasma]MDV3153992.1 RNA methyltransferase [Pigeon pea little leaf phytoplasma]MDV3163216.1 RNA methyltransferase [Pigeon pea little leaf phytoplasma]
MILSSNNSIFKKMMKLSSKKYRDLYEEFLVFGNHLVQEAIKKGLVVSLYTINPEKEAGLFIKKSLMKLLNNNHILYSQVAICKMLKSFSYDDKILILDNIQDPSNAGLLLRSACAFGFKTIFFSNNSVDIYNEKTIQVSQGAIFNLNFYRGNLANFLFFLRKKNYFVIGSCVRENTFLSNDLIDYSMIYNNKIALILGNEGKGISDVARKNSDYLISIPTTDLVESLNVAIAGSIIMFYIYLNR